MRIEEYIHNIYITKPGVTGTMELFYFFLVSTCKKNYIVPVHFLSRPSLAWHGGTSWDVQHHAAVSIHITHSALIFLLVGGRAGPPTQSQLTITPRGHSHCVHWQNLGMLRACPRLRGEPRAASFSKQTYYLEWQFQTDQHRRQNQRTHSFTKTTLAPTPKFGKIWIWLARKHPPSPTNWHATQTTHTHTHAHTSLARWSVRQGRYW